MNDNEVCSLDTSTWRGENPRDYVTKSSRLNELGNTSFVGYKVIPPDLHITVTCLNSALVVLYDQQYLPRKIVREKRLSFRSHGDCIFLFEKWSHVSKVGVGEIPFHHQIMSDDIGDVQDPRYHMSRRTYF